MDTKSMDHSRSEENPFNLQNEMLLSMLPEPIVIYSDGIIVYINEAASKLVGARNQNEVVGKSIIDFIHPDDLKEQWNKLTSFLRMASRRMK